MRTFAMKRSSAAAFKLAAALLLAHLLVTVQKTANAFAPIHPAVRTTTIPSSSTALFFKSSSFSPSDSASSSTASSSTKAAAASISSFGEFSVAASTRTRQVVVANSIATLSRKTTTSSSSSTISSQQQQQQQQSISTELPIYQLALAGSFTTALADFVMHPIDCIKTIQQSDLGMDWSILQTGSYIYETFGIAGFFHGFVTYAMADAVGGAIKFTVWELWKKHATRVPLPTIFGATTESTTTMDLTWLGPAMAFLCSSIVIVPGEFLKQQLQMAHYDGLMHALVSVYSTSGLAGFFAGYDGVLLRDIPYTMLELGMYEVFKNYIIQTQQQQRSSSEENVNSAILQQEINDNQKDDSVMNQVLAAALTGAVVALFTTPMDVIKTKLMVDSYASYADCVMTTIQNHGLASLYSGGLARLAWIVPFTAIYLPTYDFLKQQLLQRHLEFKHEETATFASPTRTSVTSPLETV